MPIRLEFSLSFEDYSNAQSLHARRGWWPRFNLILARFIAPAFGAVFIVCGLLSLGQAVIGIPFILTIGCGLFLIALPLDRRLKLKRCYKRTRMGTGQSSVEFAETQIRTQVTNCKSEIEWNAVRSFAENQKVFLLYLAPAKFIVIPKRVCVDNTIDNLRMLFREKIGDHGKPKTID